MHFIVARASRPWDHFHGRDARATKYDNRFFNRPSISPVDATNPTFERDASMETTAAGLLAAFNKGNTTAEAATQHFLDTIQKHNTDLGTFLLVLEESALNSAKHIDQKRANKEPPGRLAGVPIAIKDNICVKDFTTTAGSKILKNFVAPYDAHVIERLRAEDAVLIGKTNLDEFGMGSSNENSGYFPARNPWDRERIPGGSSGGSAAAVASNQAVLALGSDTGGSIRQPASFCNVVGLKPTYGRVSRYGLMAFGSSLDQIGPFARTVEDVALLLEIIAGHDRRDSTSVNKPVPAFSQTFRDKPDKITIGLPKEYFGEGLDSEVEAIVRECLRVYESLGATVKEVSLETTKYVVGTYYLIATAEASSNLARYDGVHYGHRSSEHKDLIEMYSLSREEGLGSEVKRRIMLGNFALSSGHKDAYYAKAMKVRRLIKEDFDKAFADCDVILGPVSPTMPFPLGEKVDNPLAMYLSDIYTVGASLAGIPGISVPCGFTENNLPVGLQILAPAYEEEKLLQIAHGYQKETDWHTRTP